MRRGVFTGLAKYRWSLSFPGQRTARTFSARGMRRPWPLPYRVVRKPAIIAESGLLAHSLVHGNGLRLIHNPIPHLNQLMPMPQQLPQIPILRAGHPDFRKSIFAHQSQQQLGVFAVGLPFPPKFKDQTTVGDYFNSPHLQVGPMENRTAFRGDRKFEKRWVWTKSTENRTATCRLRL